MKKIVCMIIGLAIVIGLTNCSSDNDDIVNPYNSGKKYLAEITVKEHKWLFGERSDFGELYEQYFYNEKGIIVKFVTNYYIGVLESRMLDSTIYTYDEKDRLVEKDEYFLITSHYKYKYQYNEFDSVSVMHKYNKDGSLNETYYYEYDSSHRLHKETRLDSYYYGYVDIYAYDGNKITITHTNHKDGKLLSTTIDEYDSHNNVLKSTYTNEDTGRTSVYEYQYEYDSMGRLIKKTFPEEIGTGKKIHNYSYNEDGTINTIHISYTGNSIQSDLIYTYTWK